MPVAAAPADEEGLPALDDLGPAEIDALDVGIIQVDDAGRVTLYNAAEGRLSGRMPEQSLGRDFFREVAPCTNLPAFRGRFLEGVRRGQIDETLHYVFGFEPRPVRVRVRMRRARQAGRSWIVIRPLETLAPSRHRAARMATEAVDRRVRAEPVDPEVCEREPIHLPGAVQAHAALLACDPESLVVTACSDNLGEVLGDLGASGPLGQHLDALLPLPLIAELRAALAEGRLADPTRPLRCSRRLGPRTLLVAVTAHQHGGRLLVELEQAAEHPEDFAAATPMQAQDAVARLRRGVTLDEVADGVVREIRAMTGFERVLVYRFDPEWNGEAVAEDQVPGWQQSLLGLRFPASDIPAQARALYTRSPSRFVVDRDAVPAALAMTPQANHDAMDLTYTQARALSPVHLEYQRNLGVNGSMSVSVLVEGRLWGLVIGHHRQPHYVTPETRALAVLVTDAFAARVHELEAAQLWREQQAHLTGRAALLQSLAGSEDFVATLTQAGAGLPELFGAGGAAVVSGDRVVVVGDAPSEDAVRALAAWLRGHLPPGARGFVTDHLAGHYGLAAAIGVAASGVLAAFVDPEVRAHLLLWFRPEVVSTVVWGGDPSKPVLAEAATRTVLPRRSFERWVEERRGHSVPWADWQAGSAETLAAVIDSVALRQGRRIAELTAQQAALARALEQKEVLAREVDHRVKNSLQIVANVMLMQARRIADPQAKAMFNDTYGRVMSVARVHDSLQDSTDLEQVDLGATLRRLCSDLTASIVGAERQVEVGAEAGVMVPSQTAVALSLIATELVTNALKYAYAPGEAGRVDLTVRARPSGGAELRVCDGGRGLPPGWSPDAHGTGRGGMGMRVIGAMLQRIGGQMTVENAKGACFTVLA